MTHHVIASGVFVWLVGALVGWCVGWIARTEQNRGWHAGTRRQLARAEAELSQLREELGAALDALEYAYEWHRRASAPPVPTVVQVNLTGPLPPWGSSPPLAASASCLPLDVASPVLVPGEGARS